MNGRLTIKDGFKLTKQTAGLEKEEVEFFFVCPVCVGCGGGICVFTSLVHEGYRAVIVVFFEQCNGTHDKGRWITKVNIWGSSVEEGGQRS